MKQVVIDNKCMACGVCLSQDQYIREDDADGNIRPIPGKFVAEADLPAMEDVIKLCPVHAISLKEWQQIDPAQIDAEKKKMIDTLKKFRDTFHVERPRIERMKKPYDSFSIMGNSIAIDGIFDKKFSSESKGRDYASRRLKRFISNGAREQYVSTLLARYKADYLTPYYLPADNENSCYYQYNKEANNLLADIAAKWNASVPPDRQLPQPWNDLSIYPTYTARFFQHFENECRGRSELFRDIADGVEEYNYTDDDDIISDCFETGNSRFGHREYMCFIDLSRVLNDYSEDLTNSFTDAVYDDIEWDEMFTKVFNEFEGYMKGAFDEKIRELERK